MYSSRRNVPERIPELKGTVGIQQGGRQAEEIFRDVLNGDCLCHCITWKIFYHDLPDTYNSLHYRGLAEPHSQTFLLIP